MANEVQVSGTMTFSFSGQTVTLNQGSTNISLSETEQISGTQSVGTDDETIGLGDIAAPGWVMLKNLDATNYIEVGPDGSSYPIKIEAGKHAGPFLWNSAAIHVKANTGACLVQYFVTGR